MTLELLEDQDQLEKLGLLGEPGQRDQQDRKETLGRLELLGH